VNQFYNIVTQKGRGRQIFPRYLLSDSICKIDKVKKKQKKRDERGNISTRKQKKRVVYIDSDSIKESVLVKIVF
jgi:hypothetical protein